MSTAEVALIISGVGALGGIAGVYGAITAHRALRWQRDRDAERSERRVRPYFEHAAWREPVHPHEEYIVGGAENLPLDYRLSLVVVNDSETATVYVRELHLQQADHAKGVKLTQDGAPDTQLAPGERMVRYVNIEQVPLDLARGFVGMVRLSTNDWIETEVEHLIDHLVEHVEQHNSRGRLDAPPDD